jgi:hypothetical protein
MKSMQIFGARFGNFNSRTRCTRSKYLKPIVIYMLVFVAIVIMPATTKAKNPTAVATTTNVTTAGGTLYSFTVRYDDDGLIAVSSLGSNDLRVTGPGGFDVAAAFVSVNFNTNGTPRIATYSIVPPGGSWDFADNGTYTVVMQGNAVFDGLMNPVAAGNIGSFTVMAPLSSRLSNISTRALVQIDNDVLIGGFIIGGTVPKQLLLRALGPTLSQFGVTGALLDPALELRNSSAALIASNDNWATPPNAQSIPVNLRPPNSLESAILTAVNPGAYTAILRGVNNTTGVGLVEVYDLDSSGSSRLTNISTRGLVQTGSNVMIAGLIVQAGSKNVIVRALGPTLANFGVTHSLANPAMELHDANGGLLVSNDNWKSTQQTEISASGYAPPNDLESAILFTLAPGNYTAIVQGVSGATGVALVEIYALN